MMFNFQDSGIVILAGVGESTDDTDNSDVDDIDDTRPVSPCNVTFVGANIVHGKSSLRSKSKTKKVSCVFIFSVCPSVLSAICLSVCQFVENSSTKF
jgi:hypothetical protein